MYDCALLLQAESSHEEQQKEHKREMEEQQMEHGREMEELHAALKIAQDDKRKLLQLLKEVKLYTLKIVMFICS